ncbi:hypothetical protein AAE02nite_42760 [Adhaeribacter aerolatus]|uniref:Replication-associated protein G2P N-terminal domain-containing protein n=1 Tax=Adhaeribacter aerolatus TaxID=670289 RepID=A0A512B3T3_9BACT|nr:phage/plasmid replication protein [Adhaeribacter aerolatus]GEO06612.1 hypothetical protein AAE02nite_42760 [Adhaeribacter aerolatus]
MVDTISIIKRSVITHFDDSHLKRKRPVFDDETGEIIGIRGYLEPNLIISYTNRCLRITGSLSKFYFGDNLKVLNHEQFMMVIKNIENSLEVNLYDAIIQRLDFAGNLSVPIKVKRIFKLIGDCKYFNRFIEKNTLYFNSGVRKKIFYDKGLESKMNLHKGKFLMRFEVRWNYRFLKSWSIKNFGEENLQVEKLFNPVVFNKLVLLWGKEYYDIHKINYSILDFSKISKFKDIENQFILLGIESAGGLTKIIETIKLSNNINPLFSPSELSRYFRKLWGMNKLEQITIHNKLISQLDEEISIVVRSNLTRIYEG